MGIGDVVFTGQTFGGGGNGAFNETNFPTAHHRFVGEQLRARARVKPAAVPVAQFYENFTGPVRMAIVEMGFCQPGELDDVVADGNIRWPRGRLPINTPLRAPCAATPSPTTRSIGLY